MKMKRKFSIIVKIEKYDEYIEKTINSIINQSIAFENNIQIILIYNENNPRIIKILDEYLDKYPNNILILKQSFENENLDLKNLLKYIDGEYINLIKHKTCLKKYSLEKVYKNFKKYPDLNIISLEKSKNKSNEEIIYLNEKHFNSTLKINNIFIKKKSLNKYLKDENDEIFLTINKILLENKKYGVIYNLTQVKEEYAFKKPEFFKENYYLKKTDIYIKLIEYCLNNENKIPYFIQYAILNDMEELFDIEINNINNFKIKEIIHHMTHVLNYMDLEVIKNIKNMNIITFYLKYVCLEYFIKSHDKKTIEIIIKNHIIKLSPTITITNKTMHPNNMTITGYCPQLFDNLLFKLELNNNVKNNEVYLNIYQKENPKILSELWNPKNKFEIKFNSNQNINYLHNLTITYLQNNEEIKVNPKINIFEKEENESNIPIKKEFLHPNYKISLIMAIYNTENYLNEAIDSVINQSIGFEENVQLILINDGSTDSSKNIALNYQKQYPKNILVLSQKNRGQATARNNGLKYIDGEYVTFMDSDDYISENTFEEAYNFLKKHEEDINIVAIPLIQFGRTTAEHKLNYKFKQNRIIDLIEDPNNPQLSASSAFFKAELFEKYNFSTDVLFSEDSVMINEMLFDNKKYGVINNAKYYYRKRDDLSSTIDTVTLKKEYFSDKLKFYYMHLINYSLKKEGKVMKFIQYLLAYDLQWMMIQPEIYPYENKWEEKEFWYYFNKVISFIDIEVIEKNKAITNPHCKKFFTILKNGETHCELIRNNVKLLSNRYTLDNIKNHTIWIKKISVKKNILTIYGTFNSYFDNNNLTIGIIQKLDNDNEKCYFRKNLENDDESSIQYLSKKILFGSSFKIEIPLKKSEINIIINYHKDHDKKNLEKNNQIEVKVNMKIASNVKLPSKISYKSNKLYIN